MVKIGLIKPSVFSDNFFKTVRIFLIVILDDQGDNTQKKIFSQNFYKNKFIENINLSVYKCFATQFYYFVIQFARRDFTFLQL